MSDVDGPDPHVGSSTSTIPVESSLSETRRSPLGRITFGALALGTAALTLTGCGLPLLPPAFQNSDEAVSPEPVDIETPTDVVEPTEPEDTPEPVGPEDTDVFAIYVGDCVNEHDEGEFSEAPTISCSEPHDFEVYHAEDIQQTGLYPGSDEVTESATEICYDAFSGFVGTSYEDSVLDVTFWFPTEEGWNEGGDREVLCLIYDPAGQSTGTLEGSGI